LKKSILKNKPLVESIFELKWDIIKFQNRTDPHYRILPGAIYDRVRKKYKFHEVLPTTTMPDEVSCYIIQHRFRKSKSKWPLIQIGPGILTLNDTESYIWEDFEKRISDLLDHFIDVYPEKKILDFSEVTLRYIDAIPFDYDQNNIFDFLDRDMKLKVQFHDDLFNETGVGKSPLEYDLKFFYPINEIKGIIHARFRKGKLKNENSLIWETMTQSKDKSVIKDIKSIKSWLKKAHKLTDKWFFKMIEGNLLKRFS